MKKFLKRYMTVLLSVILSLQFLGTPISALAMDIKEESTKKALAEEYQRAVDAVYESAKNRPWSVFYKKESVQGVYRKLFVDILEQLNGVINE